MDLGTPLRGVEEIVTRLDAYRDIGGRATQEHLQGSKWLKTSGTSFPAKAKQRSRSNYRTGCHLSNSISSALTP